MPKPIRVVMCEPGKPARIEMIERSLDNYHKIVGGFIEAVYPFKDNVAIICNDEGKLYGLEANRYLYDNEGFICDFIAGTFFIVGLSTTDFKSLTPKQADKYKSMFLYPDVGNIGIRFFAD